MFKSKLFYIVFIILGLIVIGMNVIVFEGDEGDATTKTITMDKTLNVKQGEYYTFDFNVNSVKDEGNFTVVNVTLANKGEKDIDVSYIYFYLVDDSDERIAESIVAATSSKLANSVKATTEEKGDVYFNLPSAEYTKLQIVVPDYETGQGEIPYNIILNK